MLLSLLLLLALGQSAPVVTAVSAVLWEYPDAEAGRVAFTLCVDALPCETRTPADLETTRAATAPVEHSTYAWALPPLRTGDHLVRIKACDVTAPEVCSAEGSVGFRLVIVPPAVLDPRVTK